MSGQTTMGYGEKISLKVVSKIVSMHPTGEIQGRLYCVICMIDPKELCLKRNRTICVYKMPGGVLCAMSCINNGTQGTGRCVYLKPVPVFTSFILKKGVTIQLTQNRTA